MLRLEILDREETILWNERESFHAASTMKICVMMEVFRQAHLGLFSLGNGLLITNEFTSIVDGSRYSLDIEDDSDAELFKLAGETAPISDLVERMITLSSNLATNLLVELVTSHKIQAFMTELFGEGLEIRRGVEDGKAFRAGINNEATAWGYLEILTELFQGRVVSRAASRTMFMILTRQTFNEGLPALLPPVVAVAHKTGWTSSVYHDVGIVWPPDKDAYVLAILTRGLDHEIEGPRLVSKLSRLMYDAQGGANA